MTDTVTAITAFNGRAPLASGYKLVLKSNFPSGDPFIRFVKIARHSNKGLPLTQGTQAAIGATH